MGDIFSAEDAGGRCAALGVDEARLARAFDGAVATLDQRWRRGVDPDEMVSACAACHAVLTRDWGNLSRSTDPDSPECVAYWHLRDLWRRALWQALDRALVAGAGPSERDRVEEYERLVLRMRRNASDDDLLDDLGSLRRRVRGEGVIPRRLAALLDLSAHHVAVFRERRQAAATGVVSPRRGPASPPRSAAPRTIPAAAAGPQKRARVGAEDGDDAPQCVVCWERPPSARLPCGHRAGCGECTQLLERCPLCRAPYELSTVDWTDPNVAVFVVPRPPRPPPHALGAGARPAT